MSSSEDPTFDERFIGFVDEVATLLAGVLPHPPPMNGEILASRASITVGSGVPGRKGSLTELKINGVAVAYMQAQIGCRVDSSGRYLAVTQSSFALYSSRDKTPLFRLEFEDEMRTKPACHWQVHAERGALAHLLTLGGASRPHELSALHLPVGGARGRPCLEDFLQFVVEECGIDHKSDYRQAIDAGRRLWRERQIAAFVRDTPHIGARVLSELGYSVGEPAGGHPAPKDRTLTHW